MKKIKNGLSFFTKVFLILGLLFSNLSGLSTVFAYALEDNFNVLVDNKDITINYLREIEDTDEVKVTVSENYTYLDGSNEIPINSEYYTTGLLLKESTGVTYSSSMLNSVLFDGLYELTVSLFNETKNEELGTVLYSKNFENDKGITYKVYLDYGTESQSEILPTDDVYEIDPHEKVTVVSNILAGGLNPTDVFVYDDVEYFASDLLNLNFIEEKDFDGLFFGEYTDELKVVVYDEEGNEVIFNDEINYLYGSYSLNSEIMNSVINCLDINDKYYFDESINSKDGILYVYPDKLTGYSVIDLFKIMEVATADSDINYIISNNSYDDLLKEYEKYVENSNAEDVLLPFDEYFANVIIDDTTKITVNNSGLSLTYRCVLVGDMNGDGIVTQDDLQVLINQIVELEDSNIENGDLSADEKLSVEDAMLLNQYINDIEQYIDVKNGDMEASLIVNSSDIVTGDLFDVDYVVSINEYFVSGVSGIFNYDDSMLELVNIKVNNDWIGNSNNGRFLYMGNTALTSDTVLNGNDIEVISKDYIVLTATFRALNSGETVISVNDSEFFDSNVYYNLETADIDVPVIINASDDNTLSSLTVAGQKIELKDGILDYEITVSSDVTSINVEAITNNIGAIIFSTTVPEELKVGENEITIVVMAENGDELIYKVKVIREEEKSENPTNMNYVQNQVVNDDNTEVTDDSKDEIVVNEDEDKDDEIVSDEEDSELSRIIIIILILLVIAGLIYLIFKDEDDDETKKANKELNKVKNNKDFSNTKAVNSDNKKLKNKKKED